MLDIDIPRYFCLDLITESDSEFYYTQKTKEERGSETYQLLKQTEEEKYYDEQLGEYAFQLELEKDLTTREVAQLFIDHGDVKIVKSSPQTYWINLESFGSSIETEGKLRLLLQYIRQTHKSLVRNIREYHDAHRFPDKSISNGLS